MRIRKVKVKGNKVHLLWEVPRGEDYDEYSMICSDKALPDFYKSLQDLDKHVIAMSELPPEFLKRIIVKGVSLDYQGEAETMGCVITSEMKLNNSVCNLNLNTPHKVAEIQEGGSEKQLLTDSCVQDIEMLVVAAENYIGGQRAQGKFA